MKNGLFFSWWVEHYLSKGLEGDGFHSLKENSKEITLGNTAKDVPPSFTPWGYWVTEPRSQRRFLSDFLRDFGLVCTLAS